MENAEERRPTILVCGGREYTDRRVVYTILDEVCQRTGWARKGNPLTIIQGGAPGADYLAKEWAEADPTLCQCIEYQADWRRYGKAAGPIRNKKMLNDTQPDLVVAFPGGAGTRNMIEQAKAKRVPIIVVNEDGTYWTIDKNADKYSNA